MKIKPKYLIAGAIGLVTISGALLYLQYKKLMNYKITLNSAKIKKLSLDRIVIDLYLNFINYSTLKVEIVAQEYKVYLNNKFVADLKNYTKNTIEPKSTSVIGLNVDFNPKNIISALGKNALDVLANPESVILKVDAKLKVKFYGFEISIPYLFEDNLKNLKSTQ